ncbi:MAG: hypothetical protein PF481_04595 [Bacteroidales bacterium]|jgi:hypothetical protein|nr:hypothetical protein [Bacteroidales bacterium]
MKKIILKSAIIIAVVALLSSCTVTLPVAVSEAPIGNKRGVSESVVVLGLHLNNDFGIKDAAKNGKITGAIATVDKSTTDFILVQKVELIVTAAE